MHAHKITADDRWHARALHAFNWFLGENQLEQWVYDPATGGCRDGLHAERPNENQGAESTLSFLMSLLDIRQSDRRVYPHAPSRATQATQSAGMEAVS